MIIDSHQHVWDLDRAEYPWLGPQHPEWNRTFTFEEVRPHLERNGITATVLVESADNDADTELMFAVAQANPEVVGIVVYLPLDRPDEVADRLPTMRQDPRVVGVRNLIHQIPDPDWILRPDVGESLGLLVEHGATLDYVSVLPRHLEHLPVLSERHPGLRIVVDHLSKPVGSDDAWPWADLMSAAAENPQVFGKVSGLYPEQDPASWTVDSVRRYVEQAVEVFGTERLMYGGDWPISVVAGGYDRVFDGLSELIGLLGPDGADDVWHRSATYFYGLDRALLARACDQRS